MHIYIKYISLALAALLLSPVLSAQTFWSPVPSYQQPDAQHSALIRDPGKGYLYMGTYNQGIYRSTSEGASWQQLGHFPDAAVLNLFISSKGTLYAGSADGFYLSYDDGEHWLFKELPGGYPVNGFAENAVGTVFAINGEDNRGGGVFRSSDNGLSWMALNKNLPSGHNVCAIAIDSKGNIYLGLSDDYSSGQAGLFVSMDEGSEWTSLPLRVDGKNVIHDEWVTNEIISLSIGPGDRIEFSFTGACRTDAPSSPAVSANLRSSLENALAHQNWELEIIRPTNNFWMSVPLATCQSYANGLVLGGINGSRTTGGAYVKYPGSTQWKQEISGMNLIAGGLHNTCRFVRTTSGRVYMIQLYDHTLYYTDSLQNFFTGLSPQPDQGFLNIYPNPSNGNFFIRAGSTAYKDALLRVYNSSGQVVHQELIREMQQAQPVRLQALSGGIYFVMIECGKERMQQKIIIREE
jgi:hypothetical protein